MGFSHISAALDFEAKSPGQKLVLILLAHMAREDTGACWPRVSTLARYACLRKEAVRDHLATLEKIGLITRSPRFKDGAQVANRYQFCHVESAKFVIGKAHAIKLDDEDDG